MPYTALEPLLEARRGGIWFVPAPIDLAPLRKVAKAHAFPLYAIEGRNITRKEQLLNQVAATLGFPKDFGHNWDALEECLIDMDWADGDGFVLVYDHIDGLLEAHPDQFETLVEILRDAIASWKEDGEAMVVLLSGGKAPKGVDRLPRGAG